MAALERATVALDALRGDRPSGRVRLGCIATVAHTVLPALVSALHETEPGIDLHVRTLEPEVAAAALSARDVDLVIVDEYHGARRPVRADLVRVALASDPMVACLPAGLAQDVDADSVPWVLEPGGSEVADWARSVCREHGFEPRVRYESHDLMTHARFDEQGLTAAFLPQLVIAASPLPITPYARITAQLERSIAALVRSGSEQHPAMRAVVAATSVALGASRR